LQKIQNVSPRESLQDAKEGRKKLFETETRTYINKVGGGGRRLGKRLYGMSKEEVKGGGKGHDKSQRKVRDLISCYSLRNNGKEGKKSLLRFRKARFMITSGQALPKRK